ncbi:hypothetical protein DFH27DRAFT_266561 [Peziza echinospora]|nr:hypothetical protein DFH27DRAFT_266561 [Peziza echinospora]
MFKVFSYVFLFFFSFTLFISCCWVWGESGREREWFRLGGFIVEQNGDSGVFFFFLDILMFQLYVCFLVYFLPAYEAP